MMGSNNVLDMLNRKYEVTEDNIGCFRLLADNVQYQFRKISEDYEKIKEQLDDRQKSGYSGMANELLALEEKINISLLNYINYQLSKGRSARQEQEAHLSFLQALLNYPLNKWRSARGESTSLGELPPEFYDNPDGQYNRKSKSSIGKRAEPVPPVSDLTGRLVVSRCLFLHYLGRLDISEEQKNTILNNTIPTEQHNTWSMGYF